MDKQRLFSLAFNGLLHFPHSSSTLDAHDKGGGIWLPGAARQQLFDLGARHHCPLYLSSLLNQTIAQQRPLTTAPRHRGRSCTLTECLLLSVYHEEVMTNTVIAVVQSRCARGRGPDPLVQPKNQPVVRDSIRIMCNPTQIQSVHP